jgi:hypothetical protein
VNSQELLVELHQELAFCIEHKATTHNHAAGVSPASLKGMRSLILASVPNPKVHHIYAGSW